MVEFELLEMSRPQLFFDMLECIKNTQLNDTVTIEFNDYEIKVKSQDQELITSLRILPRFFDKYDSWLGEITISLRDLFRVLGKIEKDSEMIILYNPENKKITFRNKKGGKTRDKIIYGLDCEKEKIEVPKIDYKTKTVVDAKSLRRDVESLKLFSDYVRIRSDISAMELSSVSDAGSAYIPYLARGDSMVKQHEVKDFYKIVESTYSNDTFNKILKKIFKITDNVSLEVEKDQPLKLSPQINFGRFDFYLKPLIVGGE